MGLSSRLRIESQFIESQFRWAGCGVIAGGAQSRWELDDRLEHVNGGDARRRECDRQLRPGWEQDAGGGCTELIASESSIGRLRRVAHRAAACGGIEAAARTREL